MSYDDLKKCSDDDLRGIIQNYNDSVENRNQYSAEIANLEQSHPLTEEQELKLQALKKNTILFNKK